MVTPDSKKIISFIFVCYITSLFCLTIGLDLMGIIWYKLIYQMNLGTKVNLLNGDFDFTLDFISNISGVNDIFLNILGVLVSLIIYVVGKYIVKKCSEKQII